MKNKSNIHIAVQEYLHRLFGEVASIEKPFPTIGRIADCALRSPKLIFEIQCSPLSKKEALARISDYASLGYMTIWLLHDSLFNSFRINDLEYSLTKFPHYFTNISPTQRGIIYDQYERRSVGFRLFRSPPYPIDLRKPLFPPFHKQFPSHLSQFREKEWKISFAGDLCHRPIPTINHRFQRLLDMEKN